MRFTELQVSCCRIAICRRQRFSVSEMTGYVKTLRSDTLLLNDNSGEEIFTLLGCYTAEICY